MTVRLIGAVRVPGRSRRLDSTIEQQLDRMNRMKRMDWVRHPTVLEYSAQSLFILFILSWFYGTSPGAGLATT